MRCEWWVVVWVVVCALQWHQRPCVPSPSASLCFCPPFRHATQPERPRAKLPTSANTHHPPTHRGYNIRGMKGEGGGKRGAL